MPRSDKELQKIGEDWGGLSIALGSIAAIGLLCYQGYRWLRYGVWPPYSGNDLIESIGWHVDRVRWVGLHRVIVWLADLPMAVWIFGVGLAVYGAIMMIVNDIIQNRKNTSAGR